jgi:hypothetical protein
MAVFDPVSHKAVSHALVRSCMWEGWGGWDWVAYRRCMGSGVLTPFKSSVTWALGATKPLGAVTLHHRWRDMHIMAHEIYNRLKVWFHDYCSKRKERRAKEPVAWSVKNATWTLAYLTSLSHHIAAAPSPYRASFSTGSRRCAVLARVTATLRIAASETIG